MSNYRKLIKRKLDVVEVMVVVVVIGLMVIVLCITYSLKLLVESCARMCDARALCNDGCGSMSL